MRISHIRTASHKGKPGTYAYQIVNELEEKVQLTVTVKDRPLRELDPLDELVDVRFLSPFRAGWSVVKTKGGHKAVYRARKIKVAQLEGLYAAIAKPRFAVLHVEFPPHLAAHILPRLQPHTDSLRIHRVPSNAGPELVAFLTRCQARGCHTLLIESEDEVGLDAVKQAFRSMRYEFVGRYTRVFLDEGKGAFGVRLDTRQDSVASSTRRPRHSATL